MPQLLLKELSFGDIKQMDPFRSDKGWTPNVARLIFHGSFVGKLFDVPFPSALVHLTLNDEDFSLTSEMLKFFPTSLSSMNVTRCDWSSIEAIDWPPLKDLGFYSPIHVQHYPKLPRSIHTLTGNRFDLGDAPEFSGLLAAGKHSLEGIDRSLWTSIKAELLQEALTSGGRRGASIERYIEDAELGALCGLPLTLRRTWCTTHHDLVAHMLLPPKLVSVSFVFKDIATHASFWEHLPPLLNEVAYQGAYGLEVDDGLVRDILPSENPMTLSNITKLVIHANASDLLPNLSLLPRFLTKLFLPDSNLQPGMLLELPQTLIDLRISPSSILPENAWAADLPRGLKSLHCVKTPLHGEDFANLPPQLETLNALYLRVTIDALLKLPKTLRKLDFHMQFRYGKGDGPEYISPGQLIALSQRFFPFWRIFSLPLPLLQRYSTMD